MSLRIDSEKCIHCGMCHDNCEHHGLTLVSTHDTVLYIQNAKCIQCKECLKNCPAEAIYEEVENE